MEKRKLSGILGKCSAQEVKALAEPLMQKYPVAVVRKPAKTMVLIRMKETVKRADFYLGELLAAEAMVEIEGRKGFALLSGDDLDKALHAAVIDAVLNGEFPEREELLAGLAQKEERLLKEEAREIAMHNATRVRFETLDGND